MAKKFIEVPVYLARSAGVGGGGRGGTLFPDRLEIWNLCY